MLRACMIEVKGSWEDYPHFADFLIITDIRSVSRWLHLKPCMVENAGHRYVGMKSVKEDFWSQIY